MQDMVAFIIDGKMAEEQPLMVASRVAVALEAAFLDASSHLYMRSCPSDGRSVGWSVGP